MSVTENTVYICKKCGCTYFSLDLNNTDCEFCPCCDKKTDINDIYQLGAKFKVKEKDENHR